MTMKRIWVTLTCDEGFVADSLRALAAQYEDTLETGVYEGDRYEAEIQEYEKED